MGDLAASETEEIPPHRQLGLTDKEAERISSLLGRSPNPLELAMYGVMWSEHCSYKSSRLHLRRLPTEGDRVLVGPGENAGVVDVGGGLAVALRIESHNHPSAIEPYQGAATGVGGILRDVFATGARPVALMDSLRFGPLEDASARWMFEGVVSGISGYGNSVGVPTVGGEVAFDPSFASNPIVNVLCVGVMPKERLVLARASGEGNLAVLLGARTGRDGIGGVSVLASAGLDEGAASKRPSVQVGDPFEEKRLIEACLELQQRRLVVGVQDLGGGGLTCATSEVASRAGLGMDIELSAVPLREDSLDPSEVMTSESQERMLVIVRPDDLEQVAEVCSKWEVRSAVVGTVTAPRAGERDGRLRVFRQSELVADVPCSSLTDGAPLYARPQQPPEDLAVRRADDPGRLRAGSCEDELIEMLSQASLADPSWIYGQYDHQLFLNTVAGPGADAALLSLGAPGAPPSRSAIAVSTDGCSRWCALDPRAGTAMTVAESTLNVACVGAEPVALVNCLNLGNPEHPEVMWQLSEVVDGLSDAARGLGLPVVGGNVSLYNESGGDDIDPTPVIGTLGLVGDLRRAPPGPLLREGDAVLLLGGQAALVGRTTPALGGSRWAVALRGHRGGSLPPLDVELHRRLLGLVAELVREGAVSGVHDVSDGGIAVALAEMAIRGGVGLVAEALVNHAELFSESPSRALVCAPDPGKIERMAAARGVKASLLGTAGTARLRLGGLVDIGVDALARAWRDPIPSRMGVP